MNWKLICLSLLITLTQVLSAEDVTFHAFGVYASAPENGWRNRQWVEVTNKGEKSISLRGYSISVDGKKVFEFPETAEIPKNGKIRIRFTEKPDPKGAVPRTDRTEFIVPSASMVSFRKTFKTKEQYNAFVSQFEELKKYISHPDEEKEHYLLYCAEFLLRDARGKQVDRVFFRMGGEAKQTKSFVEMSEIARLSVYIRAGDRYYGGFSSDEFPKQVSIDFLYYTRRGGLIFHMKNLPEDMYDFYRSEGSFVELYLYKNKDDKKPLWHEVVDVEGWGCELTPESKAFLDFLQTKTTQKFYYKIRFGNRYIESMKTEFSTGILEVRPPDWNVVEVPPIPPGDNADDVTQSPAEEIDFEEQFRRRFLHQTKQLQTKKIEISGVVVDDEGIVLQDVKFKLHTAAYLLDSSTPEGCRIEGRDEEFVSKDGTFKISRTGSPSLSVRVAKDGYVMPPYSVCYEMRTNANEIRDSNPSPEAFQYFSTKQENLKLLLQKRDRFYQAKKYSGKWEKIDPAHPENEILDLETMKKFPLKNAKGEPGPRYYLRMDRGQKNPNPRVEEQPYFYTMTLVSPNKEDGFILSGNAIDMYGMALAPETGYQKSITMPPKRNCPTNYYVKFGDRYAKLSMEYPQSTAEGKELFFPYEIFINDESKPEKRRNMYFENRKIPENLKSRK